MPCCRLREGILSKHSTPLTLSTYKYSSLIAGRRPGCRDGLGGRPRRLRQRWGRRRAVYAQYRSFSMVGGMGSISVPSSCSMRYLQSATEPPGQQGLVELEGHRDLALVHAVQVLHSYSKRSAPGLVQALAMVHALPQLCSSSSDHAVSLCKQ